MSDAQLLRLVYVSTADLRLNEDVSKLQEVATVSAEKNAADGITGLLLYNGLNFMQVLEGDPDTVRATYARIIQDPRHSGISTVLEEDIRERAFPAWAMNMTVVPSTVGNPVVAPVSKKDLAYLLPETVPAQLKLMIVSFNTVLA